MLQRSGSQYRQPGSAEIRVLEEEMVDPMSLPKSSDPWDSHQAMLDDSGKQSELRSDTKPARSEREFQAPLFRDACTAERRPGWYSSSG